MAKSYVTCRECGTEVRIEGRNRRQADQKAEWWERTIGVCRDCESKQELAEAEQFAADNDLPDLIGSEKQTAWAKKIRKRLLTWIAEVVTDTKKEDPENSDQADYFYSEISNEDSASWWIDHRDITLRELQKLAEQMIAKPVAEDDQDAIEEAIVRPAEITTDTVAEIRKHDDKITVTMPERHTEFNDALKALGYRWFRETQRWSIPLNVRMGDPDDRLIETAHAALSVGVAVQVNDLRLHQRIIDGDYTPINPLWITYIPRLKKFAVWHPYGHESMDDARSLPGARWNGDVGARMVPIKSFATIVDFAEKHGYEISPATQEQIDKQEQKMAEAIVVEAQKKVAPKKQAPAHPDGIADELRDD